MIIGTRLTLVLVVALLAMLVVCYGTEPVDMEHVPSSQPTRVFVAPSVPEDYPSGFGETTMSPSLAVTEVPSTSKGDSGGAGGGEFDKEILEENRTAINTSAYIFYTFIGLIAFIGAAYLIKRNCVGSSLNDAPRYQQVETHDPDEFFSKRNIEMTRGGLSSSRHF